jgi:hypothetical protein
MILLVLFFRLEHLIGSHLASEEGLCSCDRELVDHKGFRSYALSAS